MVGLTPKVQPRGRHEPAGRGNRQRRNASPAVSRLVGAVCGLGDRNVCRRFSRPLRHHPGHSRPRQRTGLLGRRIRVPRTTERRRRRTRGIRLSVPRPAPRESSEGARVCCRSNARRRVVRLPSVPPLLTCLPMPDLPFRSPTRGRRVRPRVREARWPPCGRSWESGRCRRGRRRTGAARHRPEHGGCLFASRRQRAA